MFVRVSIPYACSALGSVYLSSCKCAYKTNMQCIYDYDYTPNTVILIFIEMSIVCAHQLCCVCRVVICSSDAMTACHAGWWLCGVLHTHTGNKRAPPQRRWLSRTTQHSWNYLLNVLFGRPHTYPMPFTIRQNMVQLLSHACTLPFTPSSRLCM